MSIVDWPADQQPREKLCSKGAAALSDAELLAIFLRTGVTGKSAVDLARELLATFGGLSQLFAAEQQDFCQIHGLGPAKFVQLQAVKEMSMRALKQQISRGNALTAPSLVRDYLQLQLADKQQEVFAVLFLDSQHRVIAFEILFQGTLNQASVYPREVVKRCLAQNAAAVIMAHNHPSGVAEPSQADIVLTERLKQALALVDVKLLDHFIVTIGQCVSLAERGMV